MNNQPIVGASAPQTIDKSRYYNVGKTRIKITEHFPEQGPSVTDLLEDVIVHMGDRKKSA